MTTLVVGPFYLTGELRLDTATAGLVMSVGPTVSALVGIPAGRAVDRHGWPAALSAGLVVLLAGTVAMVLLPDRVGLWGYVGGLVLITSGYAVFQAANNTALLTGAPKDQRGVIAALLALGRNLGLITGASAMAALFALGSGGAGPGRLSGLQTAFAAASVLAAVALGLSAWGMRRSPETPT